MKRCYLLLALMSCMLTSALAQQPKKSPPPRPPETQDEDVLRIPVTLVQVDAVVTDKKGQPVTDLKMEDFEVFEDGRPQRVSNFSYVEAPNAAASSEARAPTKGEKANRTAPPVLPARLRPDQVRRTIVFALDSMSFEDLHEARRAIQKFVDEQMQPGDLVAIIPSGGGMRVLQQFTADKRLLHIAIEHLRWNPFWDVTSKFNPASETASTTDSGEANDQTQQVYEDDYLNGRLNALSLIVSRLKTLPGRKSVFLFSNSFRLFGPGRDNRRTKEELRRLIGQANSALVVFNTVDPRGLQPLNISASEAIIPNRNGTNLGSIFQRRIVSFWQDQEGLEYLAKGTGGLFTKNSNDLNYAVKSALDKDKSYYLLGYMLDEKAYHSDIGRKNFHQIEIRVKRPGLKVVTRKEFYGVPYREATPTPRTTSQKLFAALTSPFHLGDVGLRLTSLFGHDAKEGSFVRSLLHVDARDLTFSEEADGRHKTSLNLVAITFNEKGAVGEPVSNTYVIRVRGEKFAQVKRDGLIYEMTIPIKQAGPHQVRVVVQDVASERMGAANQLIEVPDINKGRILLSGMVVSGQDTTANSEQVAQSKTPNDEADQPTQINLQSAPAVRQLKRGMQLDYAFIVFNAQLDQPTGRPQLEMQLAVYRDGQPVYTEPARPLEPGRPADPKQIVVKGAIILGASFGPGEYVLQVVVTDKLAQKKYQTASQWMDFDVVE